MAETTPEQFKKIREDMDSPPCLVRDFGRAEEFFDELVSTRSPWGRETDEWCFRGQSRGDVGLLASLWRDDAKKRFTDSLLEDILDMAMTNQIMKLQLSEKQLSVVGLLMLEQLAVRHFLIEADRLGLSVPLDASDVDVMRHEVKDGEWLKNAGRNIEDSLPDRVLAGHALAQHHCIPTQLLDFTTDPLIAAHFAIPSTLPEFVFRDTRRLVVWAVHRKSIEVAHGPLRFIDAPKGANSYLRTQRGLFILDRHVARDLANGTVETAPCMTRHMRVSFRSLEKVYHCHKYTLPYQQADQLSRILLERGLRRSTLMPTFDNVARDILGGKVIRSFGVSY